MVINVCLLVCYVICLFVAFWKLLSHDSLNVCTFKISQIKDSKDKWINEWINDLGIVVQL